MASIARVFDDDDPTPLGLLELPPHEPASLANRRSLPRVMAKFQMRPHDGGPACHGIDLSFGGLMCLTDEPLWPGNTFTFDLMLPGDARPFPLRGRVAELVSFRGRVAMRVRFEDIDHTFRKRIAAWMARTSI